MIHLLVVSNIRLMSDLVGCILGEESDIESVEYTQTPDEALFKLETRSYNVVLISTALPNQGALVLTRMITTAYPDCKVLILGLAEAKETVLHYIQAGAAGYVFHEEPLANLLENIRAVHKNKALISPEVAAAVMARITQLARLRAMPEMDPKPLATLTRREQDVLRLIEQGLNNQEIAEALTIEIGTVKNHVHSILKKLNVSSREDAAAYLSAIKRVEVDKVPL